MALLEGYTINCYETEIVMSELLNIYFMIYCSCTIFLSDLTCIFTHLTFGGRPRFWYLCSATFPRLIVTIRKCLGAFPNLATSLHSSSSGVEADSNGW